MNAGKGATDFIDPLGFALDRLSVGVVILTSDMQVVFANVAAHNISAEDGGVSLKRKRFVLAKTEGCEAVRTFLKEIADGCNRQSEAFYELQRRYALAPLQLHILALSNSSGADFGNAASIMYLHDPENVVLPSPCTLRSLFGLSNREAELVFLLYEGQPLEKARTIMGISINTARAYLRNVFRKTNTARQAELIRLIALSPASFIRHPA